MLMKATLCNMSSNLLNHVLLSKMADSRSKPLRESQLDKKQVHSNLEH